MKKIIIVLVFFMCFGCISCTGYTSTTNYVTNEVTNKITNEVSEIELNYTIEDLEDAVQKVYEKAASNTIGVTLKIVKNVEISGEQCRFEDPEGVASAVLYKRIENKTGEEVTSYTYYAITNCHCVTSENFPEEEHVVYAYLGDQNVEIKVDILGKDSIVDLAVIKFDCPYYLSIAEFGDSDALEKGSFVCNVGHPKGYDYYNSITFGVVSNVNRIISFDSDNDNVSDYCGVYIQFDAASNAGNSGCGLYTLDGKLVGIPQLKFTTSEIDNMAFAIPINIVKYAIENYLEEGKEIIRPRFGITCMSVRDMTSSVMVTYGLTSFPDIYNGESPYGVYISSVSTVGSLVDIVEAGDILLEINGEKLYDSSTITGRLNSLVEYKIGTELTIKYYSASSKEIKTVNVTLVAGQQ